MFKKQGLSFKTAEGTIDEDAMYKKLASGDFEVDEETKRQAQEDISEDGYWGVAKTSDRMLDFAKALTGGDADKMKEMVKALIGAIRRQQRLGAKIYHLYLLIQGRRHLKNLTSGLQIKVLTLLVRRF